MMMVVVVAVAVAVLVGPSNGNAVGGLPVHAGRPSSRIDSIFQLLERVIGQLEGTVVQGLGRALRIGSCIIS
jgi:hypothetical protein